MEVAENKRAAEGAPVELLCVLSTPVSLCRWTWHPLKGEPAAESRVLEFAPHGNWSRNCSLVLSHVRAADSGQWTCAVVGPPGETLYSTLPAELNVYQPGKQHPTF